MLIDKGELHPGRRLPSERELLNKMKVTRSSLRKGIAFLEIFGILKSCHGSGTYVSLGTLPTGSNSASMPGLAKRPIFSQLCEARSLIEELVVGLAAERSTSRDLTELADEVAGMYAALNDRAEYSIQCARFHHTIAQMAGNAILDSLLVTLTANLYDRRRTRLPRDLRQDADEHREIYRAIRSRSPGQAKILTQQLAYPWRKN
jgi:GntR family transcriptional regulator, transcriptional repressor for pyruvate dehydrogenase complex